VISFYFYIDCTETAALKLLATALKLLATALKLLATALKLPATVLQLGNYQPLF